MLMEIYVIVVCVAAIVVLAALWLTARAKNEAADALLAAERKAREEALAQSERQLAELKTDARERLETCRREADERLETCKREADDRLSEAKREGAEQRARELGELRRSYEAQMELFKEQLTNAAEKLLKESRGELVESNASKIDELFKPIKDDIMRMEQAMNDNREAATARNTRFEEAFKQMMASNERLGNEADRLSNALRRKNKVSGDFGELILTELLESQGLKEGEHFDTQVMLRDAGGRALQNEETGARMRPDVVFHLGDDREVVLDSKVSLTAYVDYQNAGSEEERADALARHIDSVRAHVKELACKDYSSYIAKPKSTIDFVIMFVPFEGALQLALAECPALWREAFERRVFIAGGQTLIAALHIIKMTWINIRQERNTLQIKEEARKLIDRVAKFYDEFQKVGKQLEAASAAYDAVARRVGMGNQSILAMGNRLEDLGARGKAALPRAEE